MAADVLRAARAADREVEPLHQTQAQVATQVLTGGRHPRNGSQLQARLLQDPPQRGAARGPAAALHLSDRRRAQSGGCRELALAQPGLTPGQAQELAVVHGPILRPIEQWRGPAGGAVDNHGHDERRRPWGWCRRP